MCIRTKCVELSSTFFCVDVLACSDTAPGTVSVLFRRSLLAAHVDGLSTDSSLFPASSYVRSMVKRADRPRGYVLAV